jgi:hypothetical protein
VQHGGLRQSFLSHPPPLHEEECETEFSATDRLWASRPTPHHICVPEMHYEQVSEIESSRQTYSLPDFAQAHIPIEPQAGRQSSSSDDCDTFDPQHTAPKAHSRPWLRAQRPSTAEPPQASYMKPTASFLAKTAECRSRSQECVTDRKDEPFPTSIPRPLDEDPRWGCAHAHCMTHPLQASAEPSPSQFSGHGSEEETYVVDSASPVRADSPVLRVLNALTDATQLQQDLKTLGSKYQSLQELSKVLRSFEKLALSAALSILPYCCVLDQYCP